MPRTPTTPAQVSGHRFLVRRVEHALVRADSAMFHDPLAARNRAVAVGVVLTVLLAAGSVLLGVFRPSAAAADDAAVLLVRDTGSLYVRIDDTVHPVSNLASARLILGRAESPSAIREDALDRWRHGPAIGIDNAPPVPAEAGESFGETPTVGVCEQVSDGEVDTVLVRLRTEPAGTSMAEATILTHGGQHWLLVDGRRASIDPRDPVIARALGLGSAPIRPVGTDLLRIIPERPPVAIPEVGAIGEPTGFAVPFDRVGNVADVGGRYLVARQGGAVDIPETAALVLASGSGMHSADERTLAAIPVAPAVDLGSLPSAVPTWSDASGWLCVDAGETVTATRDSVAAGDIVAYPMLPDAPISLSGYLGPGTTVAIRTRDGLHVVSSSGVRHRVEDSSALQALGFTVPPELPWSGISALPEGPELNRDAALQPS